jgi:putative ABC transport system permease protein
VNPSRASFFEAASVALDSLRASKLRTFLTLLGIILSTTTLIAVMSVIHGMDVYIAETASSMGNDGFAVRRFVFQRFDAKKFLEMQRTNPQLTQAEFGFVKSHATMVREVGLVANRGVQVAYGGDLVTGVGMQGGTANIFGLSNTQVTLGRIFTDAEDSRAREVVVIGADIKGRFFPNTDPIGKFVQLDGRPFEVIGVGAPKGSVFGQSQDDYVGIPDQTYFKIYGDRAGMQYDFAAVDRDHLEEAEDEIRTLVRSYRHLRPQQDDTFGIQSSDTLVSVWDSLTSTLAGAAVGIVSVFMVVGGVVIMNIMLAAVTERTREIGVRKSVGARSQDILNQFLVESSLMSGIGGLIGVAIAFVLSIIVNYFTPIPMHVPLNAVVLGVALSAIVGLFFGIYPARRASRLDPIVALRAES